MGWRTLWSNLRRFTGAPRKRVRRTWRIGNALEERIVLTVSAYEQLFLELINRARANPTAEAARLGISLNEGLAAGTISTTPKQPLAINNSLQTAIQGHLQDMIDHDFFSHTGSDGTTPFQRIQAAGYTGYITAGENLAYQATTGTPNVEQFVTDEHASLFIDSGIAGRGHRTNMMADAYKETGSGVRTGVYTSGGRNYNAVFTGNDFGAKSGNSFLTGVAINDGTVANNFYNVGEGLGGVTVSITDGTSTFNTTTNSAGGYQIQLPAGSYRVTFSGAGVASSVTKSFTIGSQNVKVDLNTRTDVPAAPTVAFSSATYSVNEADGAREITVNLSKVWTSTVTVNYATSGGTATSGSDFTPTSGQLTFAPGVTSQTFRVPITNDTALEPTETFNVALSSPSGATLGTTTTATVSIIDNDVPAVNFQLAANSVSESTTSVTWNVVLSGASSQTITVDYSVVGGTATNGTDYRFTNGTLTFAPGQTSRSITFAVINDTIDEDDETIEMALANPSNSVLGGTSRSTYTILDNDSAPTAKFAFRTSSGGSTSSPTVSEGAGTLEVPIILSAPSARSISVDLGVLVGGTALAGADFSLPGLSSVTFAPGETRKSLFLNIQDDALDEANETIKLKLTSSQATIGDGSSATATILDNDLPPTVSFTAASSSASESTASPGALIVELSGESGQRVTVKYAVSKTGTTASSKTDYSLASSTLTFLPGETRKVLPLVLKNDTAIERPETLRVLLSSPSAATLGSLTAHIFTILDDDGPVETLNPIVNFELASKSGSEATTSVSLNAVLNGFSSQTITVDYAVIGGTASLGADFQLPSGTLTFLPGETSKAITFTVVNDTIDEDDETIEIALSNPTVATLGATTSSIYTIVDNDAAPSAKFAFRTSSGSSTSSPSAQESTGTLEIPIILSAASARSVTVNLLEVVGGTALGGADYDFPETSVTFAPGETRKSLILNIHDDDLDEVNETLKLKLASSQATISDGSTATVTIIDNDAAPTVSFTVAESSAGESNVSPGSVIVELSRESGQKVSVKYAVSKSGTTASSRSDYSLPSGTLTFLPGETRKVLPLVLKNDSVVERNETLRIVLSSPSAATLGSITSHLFTILDDDLA